jgi:hypothetical protein
LKSGLVPFEQINAGLADPKIKARFADLGGTPLVGSASTESDIERVFEHLAGANPVGLLIAPDAFFIRQSAKLAGLSARIAVPAMHIVRRPGVLISYGANLADQWRLVGVIAGRILQGARGAAALPAVSRFAWAQAYPTRHMIAPRAPAVPRSG